MRQPALFFGHGSPMNALGGPHAAVWRDLGESVGKPAGVVMVSAHWETDGGAVTAQANPETIHDFGNIPAELHAMQYPAPGSPELAARVRELRRHGWRGGGAVSQYVAGNSCLDELQAAVLSVLLRHLDDGNRERRAAARAYRDGLKGTMLDMPPDHPDAVYHQFVVRHPRRGRLREVLQREHRVPTGVHYFPPLHRHPAFAQGPVPSLPHTDRLSREVLSLPIQGEVAVDHLHEVVAALVATCPA